MLAQGQVVWQYFPKSKAMPGRLVDVVTIFQQEHPTIDSEKHRLTSDQVLDALRQGLEGLGFKVEKSKKEEGKIKVPVLFGLRGKLEKSFEADGLHEQSGTVVEIEAGRGVTNYQFLKDIFEASMMHNVNHLVIAVRKVYGKSRDFDRVLTFLDTLYASGRLELPLEGVLLVGY